MICGMKAAAQPRTDDRLGMIRVEHRFRLETEN